MTLITGLFLSVGIILNDPVNFNHPPAEDIASFRCRVLCSERSLVIWIVNGTLLGAWQTLTFSTSNDMAAKCRLEEDVAGLAANSSSYYTEFLEIESATESMVLVQCATIYNCDGADCTPSVCFSPGVIRGWLAKLLYIFHFVYTSCMVTAKKPKYFKKQNNLL